MFKIALMFAALATQSTDPLITEMQQLEWSRNAAIKAGDMAALDKIYAVDFAGIAGNGSRVDRSALFAIFKRNAGGDFTANSRILSARELAPGIVAVEGRLLLTNSAGATIGDSHYLHIFRRKGPIWEMVEGAAVPVSQAAR